MNRLIGSIFHINGLAVQSFGFKKYLPIGKVEIVAEFLSSWGVDEIVILDIHATKNQSVTDSAVIKRVAKKINVPLSVGGGVKKLEHIKFMLDNGAEKVVISSHLYGQNKWIMEASKKFGSQCIIGCIDYKIIDNKAVILRNNGTTFIKQSLFETVDLLSKIEIGEIMLHSIDNDGRRLGYDIETLKEINAISSKPLIICGGAGNFSHIKNVISLDGCSPAIGNMLNHKEHHVAKIKAWLKTNCREKVRPNLEEFIYES